MLHTQAVGSHLYQTFCSHITAASSHIHASSGFPTKYYPSNWLVFLIDYQPIGGKLMKRIQDDLVQTQNPYIESPFRYRLSHRGWSSDILIEYQATIQTEQTMIGRLCIDISWSSLLVNVILNRTMQEMNTHRKRTITGYNTYLAGCSSIKEARLILMINLVEK